MGRECNVFLLISAGDHEKKPIPCAKNYANSYHAVIKNAAFHNIQSRIRILMKKTFLQKWSYLSILHERQISQLQEAGEEKPFFCNAFVL